MPLSGVLGLTHSLEDGAGNIVKALFDTEMKTGEFYGAPDGKTIGPLMPQSPFSANLANPAIHDNAASAIHQFIG